MQKGLIKKIKRKKRDVVQIKINFKVLYIVIHIIICKFIFILIESKLIFSLKAISLNNIVLRNRDFKY